MSGPGSQPGPPRQDPDAERVLTQALRAMAGGGKQRPGLAAETPPARTSLSVLQVMLIAVIVGLLVGITVGLVTLLV